MRRFFWLSASLAVVFTPSGVSPPLLILLKKTKERGREKFASALLLRCMHSYEGREEEEGCFQGKLIRSSSSSSARSLGAAEMPFSIPPPFLSYFFRNFFFVGKSILAFLSALGNQDGGGVSHPSLRESPSPLLQGFSRPFKKEKREEGKNGGGESHGFKIRFFKKSFLSHSLSKVLLNSVGFFTCLK